MVILFCATSVMVGFPPGRDEPLQNYNRLRLIPPIQDIINQLKLEVINIKSKLEKNNSPKVECIICTEEINEIDQVLAKCGHNEFHSHCIEQWKESANSPSCPICRAPLVLLDKDQDANSRSYRPSNDHVSSNTDYTPPRSWSGGAPGYW